MHPLDRLDLTGTSVLLTGGSGFVGGHLAARLAGAASLNGSHGRAA